MKRFGPVQIIRLKLTEDECPLNCYVMFDNSRSAFGAHMQMDNHCQELCFKTVCYIDYLKVTLDIIPRHVETVILIILR